MVNPNPSRRRFLKLSALGAVVVVVAGVGSYLTLQQRQSKVPSETPRPIETPVVIPMPTLITFSLTVQDSKAPWYFALGSQVNPTIRVEQGDTVKITLKNTGVTAHDFVIDELAVHIPITEEHRVSSVDALEHETLPVGQEASIVFTANVKGSFTYYCSVPGHRELGMQGQIIVE